MTIIILNAECEIWCNQNPTTVLDGDGWMFKYEPTLDHNDPRSWFFQNNLVYLHNRQEILKAYREGRRADTGWSY